MKPQIPILVEMSTIVREPVDIITWPLLVFKRNVVGRCTDEDEDGQQCIFAKGHRTKHLAVVPHGSSFKVF